MREMACWRWHACGGMRAVACVRWHLRERVEEALELREGELPQHGHRAQRLEQLRARRAHHNLLKLFGVQPPEHALFGAEDRRGAQLVDVEEGELAKGEAALLVRRGVGGVDVVRVDELTCEKACEGARRREKA